MPSSTVTSPPGSVDPFRSALPWVLFITAMFFLNQVARMLLSPLLVPLQEEFSLSHAATGGLLLFSSVGNALSIFCSGFVSSRMHHRRVIPLSVGCYGLALLMLSQAQTAAHLQIGFTLCGVAGGLYFPSGMAALGAVADRKHWGKSIAVHELAPNLAFILAPSMAEVAFLFTDWRGALQIMAVLSLTGALLLLLFGRGGSFCGEPPGKSTLPALFRRSDTWMFLALIGVAVAMEWAPFSVMTLFLVNSEGMSRTDANTLIALTRLPTPLFALAGGWLTDLLGEKRILTYSFVGCSLSIMALAFAHGTLLALVLFVQAALPPLMFPGIFKQFAVCFEPRERSLALSMTMPFVSLLAAGLIPAMIGLCGDLGSFGSGFFLLGVTGFLCLPVIHRFGARQSA